MRPLPAGSAPSASTTRAWPAQKVPIVTAGRFVGYLTSRETAPIIGRRSMGSSRASGWNVIPLIRMTNVNLLPGSAGTLDDLIADTDDGLFVSTNHSWSIDDRRLNFQFGTEIGWLIKNGRLRRDGQNPTYTGITPRVLGQLRRDLRPIASGGCGASRTAARVSRCRRTASATARRRRASAACEVGVGRW